MNLSIRKQMLLYIAAPILLIYIFFALYNLYHLKSVITSNTKERMSTLALAYANKFDGHLQEVAMVANTTSKFIQNQPKLSKDEILSILRENILQEDLIYGGVISFEPFSYDTGVRLYCPYVYRGKDGVNQDTLKSVDLASTGFDYTLPRWEWWHTPRNTLKPIWTKPYFDDGAGDIFMATYASPFTKDGKFYGVTTIDIPLEHLEEKLNLGDNENIRFSALTKDGIFVFNNKKNLINKSVYEIEASTDKKYIKEYADKILYNTKGFFKAKTWNNQTNQWLFYTTITSSEWSLILEVDEDYIFSELYRQITLYSAFAIALFLLLTIAIWYIARYISSPIVELIDLSRRMTTTELKSNALKFHNEISNLKDTFTIMKKSIENKNNELLKNKEDLEKQIDIRTRELKLLASTDELTNLHNRRYFLDTAKGILELAKREPTELSILMIDIDSFKNINDTYGHDFGDKVIVHVSKILQELVRITDCVCRWGGEEFVVLLPGTSSMRAILTAEKIRSGIEESALKYNDKEVVVTVSIGISDINFKYSTKFEYFLHNADLALYEAKRDGRNKVVNRDLATENSLIPD